jgi:hypothetical protein
MTIQIMRQIISTLLRLPHEQEVRKSKQASEVSKARKAVYVCIHNHFFLQDKGLPKQTSSVSCHTKIRLLFGVIRSGGM